MTHGITPARLTSLGYGFDRPIVDNSTEQNRALNRRVEVTLFVGRPYEASASRPQGK